MKKPTVLFRAWKLLRSVLLGFGFIFFILLILSFTTWPYWAYHWLGTSQSEIKGTPDYIVLLGGGGMPSESNLMRTFYTYRAASMSPESKIIISVPGNPADSASTPRLVAAELILKGIDPTRILYEEMGTNTRSEAIHLVEFNGETLTNRSILLVTSPEHMRRAVLTFRKAGFAHVNALPAFENAVEAELFFEDDQLGGNKLLVPDIGGHTSVRYQFWNHLKYEILIAREITALTYYKLRGWI
jgi:uncharacterized SAM-binding protein YcdF (DUF218 family)